MDLSLLLILLLRLFLLHRLRLTSTAASAADPPLMFPSAACSDELVTFSTCLPFIGASPNNLTAFPPPQCCDDVADPFADGSAVCLCYFVLRPDILGFPLNSTKILSLTSVCAMKDQNSTVESLESLCSRSTTLPPLPPLQNIGPKNPMPPDFGPKNPMPPDFGVDSPPPPPLMGSAEESSGSSSTEEPEDELPSPPSLSAIPTTISSATRRMDTLSWTLLSLCIIIFCINHQM